MKKIILNSFIFLLLFTLNSCKEDPFKNMELGENIYDNETSLITAITITDAYIESYGIHPVSGDTINLKYVVKCNLSSEYFGNNMFNPLKEVVAELYINNKKYDFRKESLNDNYYVFANYTPLKNIENELLFKFHLYNDNVQPDRRKPASNTILFRAN